jgi:hypothetical protein
MTQYDISISPDEVNHEYRVLLRGPGIDEKGKAYVFISQERCATFVEAVNFAYRQGLRDARRYMENRSGDLYVVSGTTPDNMVIRPESWWSRMKRRWLAA